jgi:hypothetical protein
VERTGHRWKDSIDMGFTERGCADVDWTYLALDKIMWQNFVNVVVNL